MKINNVPPPSPHAAGKQAVKALVAVVILIVSLSFLFWYQGKNKPQPSAAKRALQQDVQAKWGKPLMALPGDKLVIISPHEVNIRDEFETAFRNYCVLEKGQRVTVWWDDQCGTGSSAILDYLEQLHQGEEQPYIDVVFGGGQSVFEQLAEKGLLAQLELPAEMLAAIPESLGSLPMYDQDNRWFGNALSGFGILSNVYLLDSIGSPAPAQWQDLAAPAFFDQLYLTAPSASGSARATYEMIVQSASDWPSGWARLLAVLSNAKGFAGNSVDAANAPMLSQATVSTCIDFYGTTRVSVAPDQLVYTSPAGQTGFTADPIAVLAQAPHREMAEMFVQFVLSEQGQALWALPPGHEQGPEVNGLNRHPIRPDVYEKYGQAFPNWIVNPYKAGAALAIDSKMWTTRPAVLAQLVEAAAIDNRQLMQAAKKRLIELEFPADRVKEFNRLPENIDTAEEIMTIAKMLEDPTKSEAIQLGWRDFFRAKYLTVAQ